MKKRSETKDVLDRAEWDFSAVAANESDACLRYELARETMDWAKYLSTDPMDQPFDDGIDYVPDEACVLPESSIAPSAVYWRSFPATPWLQLPLNERLESVEDFGLARRSIISVHKEDLSPENLYKIEDGGQIIPFFIHWQQSDTSIVDDFRKWLNENRPRQIHALIERGRQSLWDDLRCLSALRLRHVYSVEEAVNVTQKALGKPLYAHRPAWEKACKKAIDLFDALFPGTTGPKSIERKSNRKLKPKKVIS